MYKRQIRESSNLALAKNRYLRALRQNAEDTYRINMGMNNTRVYLERQIYSLRFMGISLQDVYKRQADPVLNTISIPSVCWRHEHV